MCFQVTPPRPPLACLVRLSSLDDVRPIHGFKLDVVVHVGVNQNTNQQAVTHHELGHHVDVPILPPAVLRGLGLPGPEPLPQLLEVERRGLATVVAVAVHV